VLTLYTAGLTGCSSLGNIWPNSEKAQRDEKLAAIIFGKDEGADIDAEQPVVAADADAAKKADVQKPVQAALAPNNESPVFKSDAEIAEEGVLQFWETITGGRVDSNVFFNVLIDEEVKFVRPVAVCVRGDLLYVVDMGLQAVFRYHRVTGQIERVLSLIDVVAGDVADIYVNQDLSFYITDTYGSRVLRYNHNGELQQIFQNKLNLVRPVSVVEDGRTGSVLVADGEYDHILVFNQVGDPYTTIGHRGTEPGGFLNITAMALTNEDVYVASRVGGRIQVLSRSGEYLYSMEPDVMRFPLSLVVGSGRVYSSEYMDNTIKVFERGRLLESVGGTGVAPGQFKRVTDLWLEDGFLYIADSLNGRIQVMKVLGVETPPAPALGQ
jgi:hypothetical protein